MNDTTRPKRPAHRPVTIDAKPHTVTLDAATVAAAREIGSGNLSAGIRIGVRLGLNVWRQEPEA